jgi:urease alpha subunit
MALCDERTDTATVAPLAEQVRAGACDLKLKEE